MRRALALSVVSALWVLAAVACSSASVEEQTLLRFFEAARTLDSTIIRKYATVGFNPRTEGIVQTFAMTAVGPEHQDRKDVTIEALVQEPSGATVRRTLPPGTVATVTVLKRTTSLVSSLSGSTESIVPRPNCACRTWRPGLRPPGTD